MHHLFLLVASSVTIQAALLQDIRNQPYSNHHDDPAGAIVKGLHYDPVGAVGWLAAFNQLIGLCVSRALQKARRRAHLGKRAHG